MEQPISEIPTVSPEQVRHGFKNKTYEIKDVRINVSWKEFSPISKDGILRTEVSQDEAVLFFPGWSAKNSTTLNSLAQNFANDSKEIALSVTTTSEKTISDSLYKEAKAIRNFITDRGLRKITLVAHSQGGSKAADLIDILQKENQNIDIYGLILLDPVGLYEQGKMELAGKFALDMTVNTPMTLFKNLMNNPSLAVKGMQASTDVIFNMTREMAKEKVVKYPKKLWNQIKEMAKVNTHYQGVKCPVVLIQGKQDPVSAHERIIPAFEDPKSLSERRKILKDRFFPNSPQVDMLVPKKIGHHGIPHFRGDSVSKVTLGLLSRYWRNH